ncbi:MAG: response regulator [Candidatus Nanopelagicales bacterium]
MKTPIRIVIAEDESIIRLDLAESLIEQGFEVMASVSDGAQAVLAVKNHKPDVAILDIKMPVQDGLSAAVEILEDKLCAVVMLTAFSQIELIEKANEAGVMAYLTKPYRAVDLVPTIEIAVSRFNQMRQLQGEMSELSEQLAARKTIEKAKSILMKELKLTEPEAFNWLQKTAMDKRKKMVEVAQVVIRELKS